LQGGASDEVDAFVELDGPAEAGGERRDFVGELVAMERVAGFEAQTVTCAESGQHHAVRSAGVE
jgi:hypothetical protein